MAQFSCKRSIPKKLWDVKGNRAKGKSKEARELNLALDNIKAQIIKHYRYACPLQRIDAEEDKEGLFDHRIDGVSHHSWFIRKKDEFMEALGLPTSRRNRGMKS